MRSQANINKANSIAGSIKHNVDSKLQDARYSFEEKTMLKLISKAIEECYLAFDEYAYRDMDLPDGVVLIDNEDVKGMFMTVDTLKRLYWKAMQTSPDNNQEVSLFIIKDNFSAFLHKEGDALPLIDISIVNQDKEN